MIILRDETIIKTSPEKIYYFLTHIDKKYKIWHPKDHVFCQTLFGSIDKKGGVIHFFEWVGRFPLYLIAQTSSVEINSYLEMVLVFPFSLLNLGMGYFKIEEISKNESKLIAYFEGGHNSPIIGSLIDFLVKKLVNIEAATKHMKEEGENLKKCLEKQRVWQ